MNGYQNQGKSGKQTGSYNQNQSGQKAPTQGQKGNYSNREKAILTDFATEKYAKESGVTTTQLRKILSYIIQISNQIKVENPASSDQALSENIKRRLKRLTIMLIYQGAREDEVMNLIKKENLNLIENLQKMKTYKDFQRFHEEFEEVVAFAKYHHKE